MPDGIGDFSIDDKAPEFQRFREFAHQSGMTQGQFSEALGIYAGLQAREAQQLQDARNGEITKLGPGASARIDAVNGWLRAKLGDELAKNMQGMMVTERIIVGLEKLLQQSQSQGGGDFSQAHRESAPANGSIPGYASMTFEQRRAAQDNAQRQRKN